MPQLDLDFTEAILNWLQATGRVDMQRVYANGFSSGASFTWQMTLLNRSVNWFRGCGPMSFVPNTWMIGLSDALAAATPKPLALTMGTADYFWTQVRLGVQQPTPPDVISSWITRNRTLDPGPPTLYSCGFMTVVNGSHAWPLTGSDPTGRGLVSRDFDWARRLLAFWNTCAGMRLASTPVWTRCQVDRVLLDIAVRRNHSASRSPSRA